MASTLMTEFHNKQRIFKAFIAVSASGPDQATERSGLFGTRRSRDGADLRFTTSDCDWFSDHLREPNYDSGIAEHHIRLVNPGLSDVMGGISEAGRFLSSHVSDARWDGGQITVIYAGHGTPTTGAWVLRDGNMDAVALAETLLQVVKSTSRHLRLDLVMDSCFAGAFVADLLEYSWSRPDHRLFVCDVFGAALPGELAWELDSHQHGAFTYAFRAMFEPLVLGSPSLPRHRPSGIRDTDRLRSGGVSWLTDDEQHAFEYLNGHLKVIGAGSARLYEAPVVDTGLIRSVMEAALDLLPDQYVPLG